jgi:hypothetical protein
MTETHAPQGHGGHDPVRQEEDHISSRAIVIVGAASLLVFLVGGWAAVAYLNARKAEHGPVALPAEAGKSKVGMVEQDFFDLAVRGKRQDATKRERLSGYGWVDRDAGVVHLPIDRAMELVAQGVRPGAAAATPPGAQP